MIQIGNAVPPLMSKEIGREIKNCLVWKIKEDRKAGAKKAAAEPEEIVLGTTEDEEESG